MKIAYRIFLRVIAHVAVVDRLLSLVSHILIPSYFQVGKIYPSFCANFVRMLHFLLISVVFEKS